MMDQDVIKAVRWLATLDTLCRPECRIRDGLTYANTPERTPIGHAVPWRKGPGKLLPKCRCTSVPITKSWRELGIDMDELPPSTRASMTGPTKFATYGEWIMEQSPALRFKAFGETRAILLNAGALTFRQLYTEDGRYLLVRELRERYPDAFVRAPVR